ARDLPHRLRGGLRYEPDRGAQAHVGAVRGAGGAASLTARIGEQDGFTAHELKRATDCPRLMRPASGSGRLWSHRRAAAEAKGRTASAGGCGGLRDGRDGGDGGGEGRRGLPAAGTVPAQRGFSGSSRAVSGSASESVGGGQWPGNRAVRYAFRVRARLVGLGFESLPLRS